jgi:tellurite resistance protein TehA-like permease
MIGMKITKEITREHMDTYLTIMVTVLVATQVIRIAQNTIQLHRQNKLIKKKRSLTWAM